MGSSWARVAPPRPQLNARALDAQPGEMSMASRSKLVALGILIPVSLVVGWWLPNQLSAFVPDGPPTFLLEWGSYGEDDGEFRHPFDIVVDSDGFVYVADTGNIDES